MKNVYLYLILTCLALTACANSTTTNSVSSKDSTSMDSIHALAKIPMVELPIQITDREAQMEFILQNFWNKFDATNTAYIGSDELEQFFVDWIYILPYATSTARQKAVANVFTKVQPGSDMFYEIIRLTERYLDDPNSPMRNEDVFIDALKALISINSLSETEKIRPKTQLRDAMKNRPGDKAGDFGYSTPDGKKGRLSKIKGDHTIILFYNPGCETCKDIISKLSASSEVNQMVSNGKLTVLALYADNETEKWLSYATQIPSEWINATDNGLITKNELYSLRAIPTLYLLDKDKRVVLKDCTIDKLLEHLTQKQQ